MFIYSPGRSTELKWVDRGGKRKRTEKEAKEQEGDRERRRKRRRERENSTFYSLVHSPKHLQQPDLR